VAKDVKGSGHPISRIQIQVLPRSSSNEILGKMDGCYKVRLTAPPVEGKANRALKDLIAKRLGIPKADVEIVSGKKSRLKSIRIHGLSEKEIEALLSAFAEGHGRARG
jgi:uncharacterized protein (TIGR00251 family)